MSRDFWDDVEAVFDAVTSRPPAERAAALHARAGARPDVLAEVEALLRADAEADARRTAAFHLDAGDVVGAFRLLSPLGAGGMGRVFAAERVSGGFTQRVAVKIIDARGPDALKRFESERQILAGLHHPHVVSLLDGGVTDRGQPYLVMEFVDGQPLDAYCAAGGSALDLEARLRLCARVASAVQYAHAGGVIHRDLKPANILVTADGAPKVLDFGIARLAGPDAGGASVTAPGLPAALTLNYASPEQLRGLPVSAASDIYSLGVICHEVLTGARPYDLDGLPIDEAIRRVDAAAAARARSTTGPVASVVHRALETSPANRYDTAEALQRALESLATRAAAGGLDAAPGRSARRRWPLAAAAVAGLAGIALAAVLWTGELAPPAGGLPVPIAAAPGPRTPAVPPASPEATPVPAPERIAPPPVAVAPASGEDLSQVTTADLEARARAGSDEAVTLSQVSAAQTVAAIERVIPLRRELLRRQPDQPLHRSRLAWALGVLALNRIPGGELRAAERAALEAVALTDSFAGLGDGFESDLALNLRTLGLVQRALGQSSACDTLRRAVRHHENSRATVVERFAARVRFLDAELPVATAPCG